MNYTKCRTVPIFVPHAGCPCRCSFCNQRAITGQVEPVSPNHIYQTLSRQLATIRKPAHVEIGFFGGSFTGIARDRQEAYLSAAKELVEAGQADGIRLSTRPDYIDDETIIRLVRFGVTTVELGAQSMDDGVLKANDRGHTAEQTVAASRLIRSAGIGLGLQMMTGLLGDTPEKSRKTAEVFARLEPNCVRIYPTLVLRGTRLADFYLSNTYQPETLDEAVSLCADLCSFFEGEHIPVIRLGLMTSDQINPEEEVLAGPYHPAFGELVKGEQAYRLLKQKIRLYYSDRTSAGVQANVLVHPRFLSQALGHKKSNLSRLKQDFGQNITFKTSIDIPFGQIYIQ